MENWLRNGSERACLLCFQDMQRQMLTFHRLIGPCENLIEALKLSYYKKQIKKYVHTFSGISQTGQKGGVMSLEVCELQLPFLCLQAGKE